MRPNSFLRKALFYSGLGLLFVSAGVAAAQVTGLISFSVPFLEVESAPHSIARLAVIGCVLAAAGCWE